MSNKTELALVKKDTVDVVAVKVKQFQENGEIHFPPSYSPENAMKSAWLTLQTIKDKNSRPALEVCTKDSIANSLLDMVVQGLNPAKKQGYFIVYGNQLTFQRSYFGTMAVTKRVAGAKTIDATVIYEGDDVTYEMKNARVVNLEHKQKFGNINKDKILGAYATIVMADGEVYNEIMTIEELRKAWSKAQFWSKGAEKEKEGSTHDEYRQEMAKKTVINRACKRFLNSSDDASLLMNTFNESDDRAEEAELEAEIKENANGDILDAEFEERPEQQLIDNKAVQNEEPPTQRQDPVPAAQEADDDPGF